MHCQTKLGRDLTQDEIALIGHFRRTEFHVSDPVTEDTEFSEQIFFLLQEGEDTLAFGRLKPLEVTFQSKTYEILGIASIVAAEKSKGNGKALVGHIKEHILKDGRTGLGFCSPKVIEFYEKCGYKTIKDGAARCIYEENGEVIPHKEDSNLIYIDGNDHLGQLIEKNPANTVHLTCPHW